MIAHLLNTEITDLATLESLPEGAVVVDKDGTAWQRNGLGYWHSAHSLRSPHAVARYFTPLLVVWLPTEVDR